MKLEKFRKFLANQGADAAPYMNISSYSLVNPKLSEYLVSYNSTCLGFKPTPMFSYKTVILFT
jgi:hypothetical protein